MRWPVPLALAIPALFVAGWVAFTPGHTARFGFLVVGVLATGLAVASIIEAGLLPRRLGWVGPVRGAALLAVAAVAFVHLATTGLVPATGPSDDAARLTILAAVTLGAYGAFDLGLGIAERRRDRFSRDWILTGSLALLGAVLVAVVPPTLDQQFSFEERSGEIISGAVTASTMVVGIFGAAAAVLGVFLAIAGIGLIPQRRHRVVA